MTGNEYALAERVAERELLASGFSPRIIRGAIRDAGGLDGYASPRDYGMAVVDFANARRRHTRAPRDLAAPHAG